MTERARWAVAYAGAGRHGRQHIAEVLEAARNWAPPERTVLVVHKAERPWWSVLTTAFPAANILAEPFDRGSGTAIMAGLLTVAERAPQAEVAVIYGSVSPSALRAADQALAMSPSATTPCVFEWPNDSLGHWPMAVATTSTWRKVLAAADRSRSTALALALRRAESPTEALDSLYPFLTTLTFEVQILHRADRPPAVIVVSAPAGAFARTAPQLVGVA